MKTIKVIFSGTLIAAALAVTGCSKQGCTDSTALNFNEKAKKDDGTCVYSDAKVTTIEISDWAGDGDGYIGSAVVPIISSSNSEAVLCYIETSTDVWWAVPYSEVYGGWTRHWSFAHDSDEILLKTQDDDAATPNPGTRRFKIVVISTTGIKANPNVDLTDYKEVKEAFNL
jgi:hypothetical protein